MWLLVQDIYDLIQLSWMAQRCELCFTCLKVMYKIFRKYWCLDIDFNLEVCSVIVFLEDWTRADFVKAVQSKLIPEVCFNILSRTKFRHLGWKRYIHYSWYGCTEEFKMAHAG